MAKLLIEKAPLFFAPVVQKRIWGEERWVISAHPHGQSVVREGKYAGWRLGELWERHREIFGNMPGESFPLLTKILEAKQDLSVQVHPDDEYAGKNEQGERGKTECWYIIDCAEDAGIILGHHAKTKTQLKNMIAEGDWQHLLKRVKVKPGDFFYVASGTVHALEAGIMVLETQQSSDTTYRIYDYGRMDQNGKQRQLHVDKALDVICVPHVDHLIEPRKETQGNSMMQTFIQSKYFTVNEWQIDGELSLWQNQYFMICSVVAGAGEMHTAEGSFPYQKGDHYILPSGIGEFRVKGKSKVIVSHP